MCGCKCELVACTRVCIYVGSKRVCLCGACVSSFYANEYIFVQNVHVWCMYVYVFRFNPPPPVLCFLPLPASSSFTFSLSLSPSHSKPHIVVFPSFSSCYFFSFVFLFIVFPYVVNQSSGCCSLFPTNTLSPLPSLYSTRVSQQPQQPCIFQFPISTPHI